MEVKTKERLNFKGVEDPSYWISYGFSELSELPLEVLKYCVVDVNNVDNEDEEVVVSNATGFGISVVLTNSYGVVSLVSAGTSVLSAFVTDASLLLGSVTKVSPSLGSVTDEVF